MERSNGRPGGQPEIRSDGRSDDRPDDRPGVRSDYERDGFVVLPDFAPPAACEALIARAGELMRALGPGTVSVFQTRDQTRTTGDPRELPTGGMIPLEAPRGTCIVLHGLLPHRSSANRSPRSRHAYSLHLIDARAHYRADNWLQRGPLPLRGFD